MNGKSKPETAGMSSLLVTFFMKQMDLAASYTTISLLWRRQLSMCSVSAARVALMTKKTKIQKDHELEAK